MYKNNDYHNYKQNYNCHNNQLPEKKCCDHKRSVTPSFLTSQIFVSQTVAPNEILLFSTNTDLSGDKITHDENSSIFSLAGNQTYQVIFSVNGINQTNSQGMIFALKVGNQVTNTRVTCQNTLNNSGSFSSGTAIGYVTVPLNVTANIQIVNIGLDTFSLVNANISILQITNNK